MRHGSSGGRRPRGRGGSRNSGGGGGNSRSRVYESNGPVGRVRGTASQVTEKYENLAKDAASAGDLVLHQNYLQHAEHYRRLLASMTPPAPPPVKEKVQEEGADKASEAREDKKPDVADKANSPEKSTDDADKTEEKPS